MPDKKRLIAFARDMRWHPTKAEEKLWRILRNEKSSLGKFRRQHPFGEKYIADFISLDHQIVIEVDGDGHDDSRDLKRDFFMSNQGYYVLRFSSDDILSRMPHVIQTILNVINSHPHPPATQAPSPLKGEGKP